jgi:PAS domain S-box-containing protein
MRNWTIPLRFARKRRLITIAVLGAFLFGMCDLLGQERKRIIVASGDGFVPMMFLDENGEPAGSHVELWKLWSEKAGVELELRLMDWAETIPALRAGDVDVVAGASYSPERAEFLDFTEPYDSYDTYIFYHSSIEGVNSLEDIEGFPVGILRGSIVELEVLKQKPDLHLMTYPNYEQLVKAALDGKIRVFLGEEPVISYFIAKDGRHADLLRSDTALYSSELRDAVRKGDAELLALLERGRSLIPEGERQALLSEWTGVDFVNWIPWRWLIGVAVLAAGAIALLFFWNTSLRREVDTATRVLLASEKRYRGIIEDQTELIWRNRPDGTITFVNDAFCRAFDRPRKELLDASILPLIAEDDRPAVEEYFASFGEKMGISTHEHRVIGAKDSVRWQQWINRGIFGDDHEVVEIQGTGRDVTERRQAEEERKLLFTAIEQAAEAIVVTDAGGIIQYINPALRLSRVPCRGTRLRCARNGT